MLSPIVHLAENETASPTWSFILFGPPALPDPELFAVVYHKNGRLPYTVQLLLREGERCDAVLYTVFVE